MNLHEFQSKALFSEYGIPVPEGYPAATVDDAVAAARALGGGRWARGGGRWGGGGGRWGGGAERRKTFNSCLATAAGIFKS
ncbi:MAG: hypothetical protein JSV00_02700 [bacterium]|nr:MAG: hypothetical protein JSV00_02700 [bacterium]